MSFFEISSPYYIMLHNLRVVIISYNSALAYMNFLDLPLRSLHYFEIQLRELNEIGRFKRELKEFLK